MPERFVTARRRPAAALVVLLLALPSAAFGQDDERRRAFELFAGQDFVAALPLLEKLAARHPDDGGVLARFGLVLYIHTIPEADTPARRERRKRARAALARAKELGFDAGVPRALVDDVIAGLNPDGSDVPESTSKFSAIPEAEEAMRAGEAAFLKNDLDAALASYERAMRHDPKLYEAPLFAGDVMLRKGDFARAGEWYERAIRLNPDRDQAYRYWGNTLLRQAKLEEAREKYVEAVVAAPYNSYVWENGLFRWAEAKAVRLGHPQIEPPVGVSPLKDGQMTINVDPKALEAADGSAAWMWYGMARAAWAANNHERFRKAYPSEKTYRHSLREEADALRAVVEAVKNQQKEGKVRQLAPDLAELVKLHDEGLLEAFVLFARVRQVQSVVDDYRDYRREHRDKLRRYLLEYVTSGRY